MLLQASLSGDVSRQSALWTASSSSSSSSLLLSPSSLFPPRLETQAHHFFSACWFVLFCSTRAVLRAVPCRAVPCRCGCCCVCRYAPRGAGGAHAGPAHPGSDVTLQLLFYQLTLLNFEHFVHSLCGTTKRKDYVLYRSNLSEEFDCKTLLVILEMRTITLTCSWLVNVTGCGFKNKYRDI